MRYADFEWVFVDMGSTFVDESLCIEKRITDTIASSLITKAEFEAVMRRLRAKTWTHISPHAHILA